MNSEVEKHKIIAQDKEKELDRRIKYIKLKHKHIMEELEFMAKNKIKHFER